MNVFEWLWDVEEQLWENGHERLATILDEISSATCDGRHDEVERLTSEGLALARDVENKWIEIYLRHWRLQSRVLHRHDVSKDTLQEAVSLMDFSSQDDTKECPQSICATQDLAACYGYVDGPGFVQERIAAADETLSRITPAWPCFDCITGEKASALLDGREFERAVELCERRVRDPNHEQGSDVSLTYAQALLALGRRKEALKVVESYDPSLTGQAGVRRKELLRALCLTRLERLEEAIEVLPPSKDLTPQNYLNWLRCVRALGRHETGVNSWRLERIVSSMVDVLRKHESHYILAKVHVLAAQLAVIRGNRETADRHASAANSALSPLRAPGRLVEKLNALKTEMAAMSEGEMEELENVEEFLETIGKNPEEELARLRMAFEKWPDAQDVGIRYASALSALARQEEAVEVLLGCWKRTRHMEVFHVLAELYLEQGRHSELTSLTSDVGPELEVDAAIASVRSMLQLNQVAEARHRLESVLEVNPDRTAEVRSALIHVCRRQGDLPAALNHLNTVCETEPAGSLDWDRMLIGSRLNEWSVVRDSARRLEFELSDQEGPIAEAWGLCLIRHIEEEQERGLLLAARTGPISARILSVAPPAEAQYYGDEVYFDGTPLNLETLNEAREQEATDQPLAQFAAVYLAKPGGYRSYSIDGVHPGDEGLSKLRATLDANGAHLEVRSDSSEYRLYDGQDDDQHEDGLPGMYGFIAAPESLTPEELHGLLRSMADEFDGPLVWMELAEKIPGELERQSELCERFGIE